MKSLAEKYAPRLSAVVVVFDSTYGVVKSALQLMSMPGRRAFAVRADALTDVASILQRRETAEVVKLLCQSTSA